MCDALAAALRVVERRLSEDMGQADVGALRMHLLRAGEGLTVRALARWRRGALVLRHTGNLAAKHG